MQIRKGAERARRSMEIINISGLVWYWVSNKRASMKSDKPLRYLIACFGYIIRDEVLATIGLRKSDFEDIRKAIEGHDVKGACELVKDDMLKLAITGSFERPGEIIERIKRLEKVGVTEINIGPPLGPDHVEVIKFTGEKIIPAFVA